MSILSTRAWSSRLTKQTGRALDDRHARSRHHGVEAGHDCGRRPGVLFGPPDASNKAISSKENPYGKIDERVYTELSTEHPIDLCRYQVANCYMGRAGLINSGGASGSNDFAEAVKTAVINKRAGGMGLISGRKAFQRSMVEGVKLLNTIQDVYLCKEVTVA
jgi:hypothetical protein